jgi:iron complex outermembrane recepter protein
VEPSNNTAAPCNSTVYGGATCLRSGGITGAADRVLRYDENPERTLRGEVERTNLFGTARRDFGSVEGFAELGYYHANFGGSREQSAPVGSAPITVPANNFYNPFGPTTLNGAPNPNRLPNLVGVPTGGLAVTIVNYRPVDTGPRSYTVTDDSYRVLGGLRGKAMGFSWESALTYSLAKTKDATHNAISNTRFQQALARTTADAYNPFNGGSNPTYSQGDATPSNAATIQSFLVNVYRIDTTSLAMIDFKISRPDAFHLPGGDVGFAAGVEYRRESYEDNRDDRLDGKITYTDLVTGAFSGSDVLGASPSPDVKADRGIASAYVELAVPVISEEMGLPFVKSFDVQLAARDERYSDFGNVLKPKVAFGWKVLDGLMVRGSASQSFRAPNLPQFYSAGTQVSNGRTDFAFCRINNVTCASLSTTAIRTGNQNLKPEEADNASIGLVLESKFLPEQFGRFTATVDYWSIREKNVIGIETDNIQILYDFLQRLNGSTNPNVVRLPTTEGQTVGQINFIRDDYMNITPRRLQGIDIEVDYDFPPTPFGEFSLRVNGAKLLRYDQSPTDVQAQVIAANEAGSFGPGIVVTAAGNQIMIDGTPEWRGTANLNWRMGQWRAGAFVNYVGPVSDTGPAVINGQFYEIRSWTTVNLYGQYNFKGMGLLDDSSIRLGVRNIADKDPPLAAINTGYLGQLHNPTGRYTYVTLAKRF